MRIKGLSQNKNFRAFILGAFSALVFAPTNFFIAGIIGFSGLFLLNKNIDDKKESFWLGWWFGFGHFLIGLYWISISLLVDIKKFAWLIPFAVSLIPAILACFTGATIVVTNLIAKKRELENWKKIILFALCWVVFEYVRSNFIFSGFPWNLIGYSFGFSLSISQIASVFGIYGLSLLAIIICTTPALFVKVKHKKLVFVFEKKNLYLAIPAIILLLTAWIWGWHRLAYKNEEIISTANLRLVQPAISQKDKWDLNSRYSSFMANVDLSVDKKLDDIDFVIWSESAVPYLIEKNSDVLLAEMAKATPKNGFLITGGLRAEFRDLSKKEIDRIWNSVFVTNKKGEIVAFYDKNRLVPFGEYIPLETFFPFISKITEGAVSFSPGSGPQTIKINDLLPSFGPLICYEVIYPNKIIDKLNPPQFLVNLTNDAWFGHSSGPYQHFAMTRIRAIEYGIPVVRVANNGISALISPYGEIIKQLDLDKKGVIDVKLETSSTHAIYGQNGANTPLILAYFILLLILL